MLLDQQIPNKKDGEHLELYLRRHWIYLVNHYALYLLMALIPVGLYFFGVRVLPQLLEQPIAFAFLFLLGSIYYLYIVLFFYATYIDYYLDVWIVTNKRIIAIEQKGLFNRTTSETELERVQDVTASQKGFFATFFTYGDITVQTAAERIQFVFKQVDNPFEVQGKVQVLAQSCKKEAHHE